MEFRHGVGGCVVLVCGSEIGVGVGVWMEDGGVWTMVTDEMIPNAFCRI